MYTREEASKVRARFWTSFGQYMKPIPSASGQPVNWINYKTGIKHIHFKMDAGTKAASIAIEIAHPQEAQRLHFYNQFLQVRKLLETTTGFNWEWNETVHTEYKLVSSISQQLAGVKVLNENDWPAIISFLKPRILALDAFWEQVKDGFE